MKSLVIFCTLLALASAACPAGWSLFPKTNSCYKHFPGGKDYQEAKAACAAQGAVLASISSVHENEFVQVIATLDEDVRWGGQPWIGAYTDSSDGTAIAGLKWKWVDGQPWSYSNWCPQNPDNSWEKCVQLLSDNCPICQSQFRLGCWNNIGCQYKHPYICKKPNPS
ncbi:hypothetical protein QR680_016056 [Steinernema hermaphroditum]|uniref:C-type lectin domain-containing protein n=1 Tax=Steinernema hermaphroditum TaxID=289476 RepID=A0AA39LLA3_9BILA|nr:hypothetical protein QR680_016056 [Steinernema hermaphroditum]